MAMRSSVIAAASSAAVLSALLLAFSPAPASGQAAAPAGRGSKLLTPAALTAKAPAVFQAKFDTSKGVFVIEVHREWAPLGADRFYNLVTNGFFNGARFFRVIPNFMAQFGINGNPAVTAVWEKVELKDEDAAKITRQSNTRGFVSYGNTGRPNSRGTQLFINYKDNSYLDGGQAPFYPFGKITEGMDVVDMLNAEYGSAPQNQQARIASEGNKFLQANFPKLDYVKTATIVK
jgi:peptidyl-prolyl cis-trans isomerase A (cyclophilin A)